jgi:hypothetical protein
MKKANVWLIGLILFLFSIQSAWAQKEKFHSIFIYNFSKYVKWPDDLSSGKFVIGVFGSSSIKNDLEAMASTKKVNGLTIEVKQFNSTSGIGECNILYVSSSESGKIAEIIQATNNKPVLLVTDKPGLAKKGAAINFVEQGGKVKFELNQQNAESRGLKVSGSLSSLAIIV